MRTSLYMCMRCLMVSESAELYTLSVKIPDGLIDKY